MSDTPLFDATLSEVLARARREVEVAQAEVERLRREALVRAAIVRDQVEDAVRAELAAAAPPLIDLTPVAEDDEPVAPPVPAFHTLRTSGARIDAFFDSLIGP